MGQEPDLPSAALSEDAQNHASTEKRVLAPERSPRTRPSKSERVIQLYARRLPPSTVAAHSADAVTAPALKALSVNVNVNINRAAPSAHLAPAMAVQPNLVPRKSRLFAITRPNGVYRMHCAFLEDHFSPCIELEDAMPRLWRKNRAPPTEKRPQIAQANGSKRHCCNGKQPICTRCKAYGYSCNWQVGKRRGPPRTNPLPEAISTAEAGPSASTLSAETESLRSAIQAYDELATQLRARLPDDAERVNIDSVLSRIRRHLPHELLPKGAESDSPGASDDSHSSSSDGPSDSYFGEASDVHFFHAVKHAIQGQVRTSSPLRLESYQRDYKVSHEGMSRVMPTCDEVDRDIDWFFLKYNRSVPFMCERTFRGEYERYRNMGSCDGLPDHFLPTLLSICAVSDLYHNLMDVSASKSKKHEVYHTQAWHLVKRLDNEYSRPIILVLILQCQYLLITCQYDRMAQILRFHVIDDPHCNRSQSVCTQIEKELRRRAWHVCYALDCLLALQLGRPMCIGRNDSIVNFPSAHHDLLFDYENDTFLPMSAEPQPGAFLKHYLAQAHIIGDIVHDLYAPKRSRTSRTSIAIIEALDQKLIAWKLGLPPHLRFDLEHSAEEDAIFEGQRGGLAWNFHNLRALIHRPHVCVGMDNAQVGNTVRQQIMASGQICVAEAQIVARMLCRSPHRRPMGYPLYHLVPFVVGTCTILLAASRYPTSTIENSTTDNDQLEADVANCVQFLDSYAQKFRPAKHAADMIRTLQSSRRGGDLRPSRSAPDPQETVHAQPQQHPSSHVQSALRHGYHINQTHRPHPQHPTAHHPHLMTVMHGQNTLYPSTIPLNSVPPPLVPATSDLHFASNEQWQAWPEDYFDSLMMWPSQFVLPTEYNMPPLAEGSWNLPLNTLEPQGQQQQQQGHGTSLSGHEQEQRRPQNQP
ncbi:hypothetical protein CERZMDRAFT_94858 [Cercospora zeae-maydis SCOH1-5]|uniref:Xylanolytic transcriptional activator regulatory domain-containing protein n=1 Tax=Cercospora zeae-maydis SCOH1-5 TaxID=717836 RepID=A0A6A6FPR9_9PEZI|nr:hypothetical protein CERZMDRAFT_94858 [Cercospora zeae-maydis SCOH1-5]